MKIKSKQTNNWLKHHNTIINKVVEKKPVKQIYSGFPELLAAQDAICKIPISMTPLKENVASTENGRERAVIGCLESVERLGLVGISGLHAVRYLKSVLLDALEPESDESRNSTNRGSCSIKKHPPKKRKVVE